MQEGKLKKLLPGFVQIARKRRNLLGDVPSELAGGGKNETIFGHSGGVSAADGCGQNQVDAMISEPEQNGLLLEQAEITENASIKLATEWDVYDPSMEEIWFWIENDSGNDVTFGQEYTLEKWLETDGGVQDWYQVPLREDVGWESVLYLLASGGKQTGCCRLSLFDNTFSAGDRLRIVKEVEGQTVAAEFRLEEGTAVSVETPYGFGALEELPERYGAAEAAGSGAVIYTRPAVRKTAKQSGRFWKRCPWGFPANCGRCRISAKACPWISM